MYIEENVNPQKKKTGDCVIRAVAKATGQDWHRVFFDLCKLADSMCEMPNSMEVNEKYLENFGFRRVSYKVKRGCKRPTVRTFCAEHPRGVYVLRVANHVTCAINGNYYDIWDCGDCAVYSWFEKKA